jgi:uncharacterized lipoprotein YbaY
MLHFIRTRLAPLACMALACAGPGTGWAGTLQGTAAYRERMMLPPDAVFEAQLQDIARADAPATVLGRARLDPAGQPPFRFEIAYDDAAIKPGGRYAVRATVTHRGQLLFTTDRIHPVLDGRNAPLELLLVSARREPAQAGKRGGLGKLPASFEGELPGAGNPIRWHVDLHPEGRFQLRTTHVGQPAPNRFDDIGRWTQERESGRIVLRGGREAPVFLMPVDGGAALRKLDLHGKPIESAHNDRLQRQPQFTPIEPRLFLSGMFVYLADAANIVLCADSRSMPVAVQTYDVASNGTLTTLRDRPPRTLLRGRWHHEGVHDLHAGAREVRRIARDDRQIVEQRGGRNLLVQGVLGVRNSESPPYLRGVGVEGEHFVRVLVEHSGKPVLQQARLLGSAAQPDEFDAATKLADRDDRQIDRVAGAGNAIEELDDAGVRPGLLAGFADDVGVNQVHGVPSPRTRRARSPRRCRHRESKPAAPPERACVGAREPRPVSVDVPPRRFGRARQRAP